MPEDLSIEDTSQALRDLRESNNDILELIRIQGAKIDWVIASYEQISDIVKNQGLVIRILQETVGDLLEDETPRRYTPERFKVIADSIWRLLDDSRSGEISFAELREIFGLHPRDLSTAIREVVRMDPRVKVVVNETDRRTKRICLVRDEEG